MSSDPWHELSFGEKCTVWIAVCLIGATVFGFGLAVIGMAVEAASQNMETHDRCLKDSVNAAEAEQCRAI